MGDESISMTRALALFRDGAYPALAAALRDASATGAWADDEKEAAGLLLVHAWRELGEDEAARRCLWDVKSRSGRSSDALLLASGLLAADAGDRAGARRFFALVVERDGDAADVAAARLCLADLALAEGDVAGAAAALAAMTAEAAAWPVPLACERDLLEASCRMRDPAQRAGARAPALAAFARAHASRWRAWEIRALLALAAISGHWGESERMAGELALAEALLDPVAMPRLARMAARVAQGEEGKGDSLLRFDHAQKRIAFGDRWLAFHEKPILFHFLARLHGSPVFVGKRELAEHLWPDETYKPRIHDPRLFDIARRVRTLLQGSPARSLTLLSGRLGYLLVRDEAAGDGARARGDERGPEPRSPSLA